MFKNENEGIVFKARLVRTAWYNTGIAINFARNDEGIMVAPVLYQAVQANALKQYLYSLNKTYQAQLAADLKVFTTEAVHSSFQLK